MCKFVRGHKLMFCLKRPDESSHLCFQCDCSATTGACIGETKQAVLNEFIMQRQSLKACFSLWALLSFDHLTSIANETFASPCKDGTLKSLDVRPMYIFTLYTDLHFYSCWKWGPGNSCHTVFLLGSLELHLITETLKSQATSLTSETGSGSLILLLPGGYSHIHVHTHNPCW